MSKYLENASNKNEKKAMAFRCLHVLLPCVMMFSMPAYAEYSFQVVIPPGADNAQTFGINNAGKVTGGTFGGDGYAFMYDMKSGEYTDLGDEMSVLDISNPGVMVGDVDRVCAIRDKKGNITTFFPPSLPANYECQARGVNPDGKVSGYVRDTDTGEWFGFIYDPEYGTYEEFLSSGSTIAHAINAQGQNVGHVRLGADEAFPGSPAGGYGYLRQTDGAFKYFAVSQSAPGRTRARGISENGLVSGWFLDSDTNEFKGFVTTLSDGNEFEDITLSDEQILQQSPCNPDFVPTGDLEFVVTDMFTSQIRNDGVVVGSCTDYYYSEEIVDFISFGYGFIATPDE